MSALMDRVNDKTDYTACERQLSGFVSGSVQARDKENDISVDEQLVHNLEQHARSNAERAFAWSVM